MHPHRLGLVVDTGVRGGSNRDVIGVDLDNVGESTSVKKVAAK